MAKLENYNKKTNETGTGVRIGEVRIMYAHVFSPRRNEDGTDGKFGCCAVWSKDNAAINALTNGGVTAAKAGAKDKGIKLPANCKTPIRDGDLDHPDDPDFAGCYFMNVSAQKKPGLYVRQEDGTIVPALDDEDIYSGCYAVMTLNFYAYDHSGNKGVAAGLNNLMKVRDGERLSGGSTAQSDFADLGTFGDPLDCLN